MKFFQAAAGAALLTILVMFTAVGVRALATTEGGPVAVGAAMAQPSPPGAAGPPVVLVAPRTAPATVDTGTIAGQTLTWAVTTFGSAIAAALTAWLYRLLQKEGINVTDAQRARLQDIVENALHISAHELSGAIQGKGDIEVKNAVLANAVRYVQLHGADTLKALGHDPSSQAAVEAIRARALSAINDPGTPTPAILAPAAPRPPQAGPVVAAATAPKPA
jgi:hypothetical protein